MLMTSWPRLRSTFQSAIHDEDVADLVLTSTRILNILSPAHHYANADLVTDCINVFVPLAVQAVQYFPIPRLEVSTPGNRPLARESDLGAWQDDKRLLLFPLPPPCRDQHRRRDSQGTVSYHIQHANRREDRNCRAVGRRRGDWLLACGCTPGSSALATRASARSTSTRGVSISRSRSRWAGGKA